MDSNATSRREFLQLAAGTALVFGATGTLALEERVIAKAPQPEAKTGYAEINGLRMYYEIHGKGSPMVLLHGAFGSIGTDFAKLLPLFAKDRQVIAIEQQAHGHTNDIADRPLSYEQMADDTAALLKHLQISNVDVVGYSMGGGTALQMAKRHPALVRKFVYAGGAAYRPEGVYPQLFELEKTMTAALFADTPWKKAYDAVAPNPANFPMLVEKVKELDLSWRGWPGDELQSIAAPAMLIIGDADISKPEHVAEMFRLFGGGLIGDLHGIPNAQMAVLPGTSHVSLIEKTDWLVSMIDSFLRSPITPKQ